MLILKKRLVILIFILCSAIFTGAAQAQTTAFNFQGRLNDGANPANGNYDLRFKLFDAIVNGTELGLVERPNLQLVNGVFSTSLDFGPLAFQSVGDRFLEIAVRPAGSPNPHVVLGARQQLLSVPFAVRAINSTNSVNATNATSATTAQNSLSLGGVAASNYAKLNTANTGELIMDGNIRQTINTGGTVKAMVQVDDDVTTINTQIIEKCYNGITGASTGNCGFAVSSNIPGVYQVNFGFPVNNRFVSAIGKYNGGGGAVYNIGVNYKFPVANTSVIEIFTFASGDSEDTFRADFTVIVY